MRSSKIHHGTGTVEVVRLPLTVLSNQWLASNPKSEQRKHWIGRKRYPSSVREKNTALLVGCWIGSVIISGSHNQHHTFGIEKFEIRLVIKNFFFLVSSRHNFTKPKPRNKKETMLTSYSRTLVARSSSSTAAAASKRMMSAITGVKGREIIDSRGNPTVEVDITTANGTFTASVPSGASTGIYEACELRDGGSRYMGKGVLQAVNNVNTVLKDAVMGLDAADQRAIDDAMLKADGSPNKVNVGANAILGSKFVSFLFFGIFVYSFVV